MADRDGKPWPYGSTVENGIVRFLSPSGIERGDPSGNGGGCLRKWFYRYVLRWKEAERDWQTLGKQCHNEIEHYLTTGEEVLGRIAMAAKPYIPAPDPAKKRLLVEFDIGMGNLNLVSLRAAGVPIIGYTDVIHAEPAVHETGEGFYEDPPHTIEALDWKFGSAKKGTVADEKGRGGCFAKTGIDLASDTQMVVYGEWAARVARNPVDHVRLSHVYTNTKGRPESSKASTLVTREHLAARWEYTEAVVRTIVDVARERDPERVPANTNACGAFGGCAYQDKCSAARHLGIDDFFGREGSMALLEGLNLGALAPSPTVPVTVSPAGVTAALGLGVDIAAQMASLAAPAAPVFTPTQPTREFAQACVDINSKGYGFVKLEGRAAQMFGVLNGKPGITAEYTVPGFGRLGQTAPVEDPARVIGIAAELAPLAPNPTPDMPPSSAPAPVIPGPTPAQLGHVAAPITMGLMSPETPASNPTIAAVPVEGFSFPGMAQAVTPGVAVPGLIGSVPPAIAAPILAAGAPAQVPAAALPGAPAEVAAPAAKTRKPRGPNKPKPGTPPTVVGHLETGEPIETAEQDGAWLFVNAIPNVAYTDLQSYVDTWAVGMARHYHCDPADIRCASKDSPIGYGAAYGAITAVARRGALSLPAGAYYLDLRGSKINEAAFEGLRQARAQIPVPGSPGVFTDGDPVFELIVRGHER